MNRLFGFPFVQVSDNFFAKHMHFFFDSSLILIVTDTKNEHSMGATEKLWSAELLRNENLFLISSAGSMPGCCSVKKEGQLVN